MSSGAAARIGLLAGCLVAAIAVAPGSARAATLMVSAKNFFYSPTPLKLRLGDVVVWQNDTVATAHTATSDGVADGTGIAGLGLWDTSAVNGGKSSGNVTFDWAGTFKYHCSFHAIAFGMRASVKVLPAVSPKTGTALTTFTLTWAEAPLPAGLVFDVKLKRPGQVGSLLSGPSGTTELSRMFTPDAGPGRYSFRVRVRDPVTGLQSGYSPARHVTVS